MKRKPILLNKLIKGSQSSRKTIGLLGIHHGVGVTYTGMLLAFYMGEELGKKTAYLECNNHHDLSLIEPLYRWNSVDKSCFVFRNITFYKDVRSEGIANIFNSDYECLILDFGIDMLNYRNEFLRCGTKIVISSQAEWNKQRFMRFIKSNETIRGNETWLNFIPYADNKMVKRMKAKCNRMFFSIQYEEDPTKPSKENIRLFDKLFE